HILIPLERTEASELGMLTQADSLEILAERQGLDAAAEAFGLQVQTVTLQALIPFLAGAGQVGEGADWAMEEALPGDVSPLFETPDAFYVLELVNAVPAGELTLEEASPTIRTVLSAEKKTQLALDDGAELVQQVRAGQTLDQAVAGVEGL